MLSFVKEKLYVGTDNDGLNFLRGQVLKKITSIFMDLDYLTPFHWFLLERIMKRENSLRIYETWVAKARLLNTRVPLASMTSVNTNGIFYNGVYISNDNLIIHLALKEYLKNKKKDMECYCIQNIWYFLKFNREFRRVKLQPSIISLFLYIHEHKITLLLGVKRLPLGLVNKKLLFTVYATSENRTLLTMSELIKDILPSWEIGPPSKMNISIWILEYVALSKKQLTQGRSINES